MRSANPALLGSTFAHAPALKKGETMTLSGVVTKTLVLLSLVLLGAAITWNQAFIGGEGLEVVTWMLVGGIGGLVVALVTIVNKAWAPVTAPVFALLEGLMIGGFSSVFEHHYSGLVIQSVCLTFGVAFTLLLAYRTGLVRPHDNFMLFLTSAAGGIVLVYAASFVLNWLEVPILDALDSSPFGLIVSGIVVVLAALNLVMDFDYIEEGCKLGTPKHMEWYGAFGLMVTLIWLYLEIVHILYKLNQWRNGW